MDVWFSIGSVIARCRVQYGKYFPIFSYFAAYFTSLYRSSRPDVFCKKGVLRNFTKLTGKTPVPEYLSPATLLKKTMAGVFCDFGEISKNTFITEQLRFCL